MSADGELYISESCRDTFEKEMNDVFGEDKWVFDHGPYCDLWDMNIFPLKADVLILDREVYEIIGKAVITSRANVVENIGGRSIELEPTDITITKIKED